MSRKAHGPAPRRQIAHLREKFTRRIDGACAARDSACREYPTIGVAGGGANGARRTRRTRSIN
eukprot:13137917-Alexandrium_andersonii.AAC.1